MGSLQFGFSTLISSKNFWSSQRFQESQFQISNAGYRFPSKISSRLRSKPKNPLWRSRIMTNEAIQAVQYLKLAKTNSRLQEVFKTRITRLIKSDLLATLMELQRQNEWELAVEVFRFMRKEVWYKPDLSLYHDMIFLMGKNKLVGIAEELFSELKSEGLEPNTRTHTEMLGAFLQVGMVEKAMETYKLMKNLGCDPDKLTLTILIRNLEKAGEEELASSVKKDCAEYLDFPQKFLREVEQTHPKRSVGLV